MTNFAQDSSNIKKQEMALKDAFAKYSIKIGAAINGNSAETTLICSDELQDLMTKHFNITTFSNIMKPAYILNQQKSIDNLNAGKDMPGVDFKGIEPCMRFCMEHSIKVRGHVLIWHNSMPEWFFRVGYKDDGKLIDQPTLRNRMEGYFKQVIQYFETTYPDVIYAWDVVNEAVEQDGFGYEESLWYQIYGGVSYIADAFQIARKYSKPPVKLFYNDYNVFIPLKTQKIIEITKPILDSGNLDGIGMQAYYNADYPGVYDGKDNIRTAVLRVAQEGFEIAFTEFTVRVKDRYNIEKDDYEKQAQRYAEILRMLLELKKSGRISITSITFFGLIDEYYSYILKKEQTSYDENEFTRLFDKYLRPKPAFYAVLNTALQL